MFFGFPSKGLLTSFTRKFVVLISILSCIVLKSCPWGVEGVISILPEPPCILPIVKVLNS